MTLSPVAAALLSLALLGQGCPTNMPQVQPTPSEETVQADVTTQDAPTQKNNAPMPTSDAAMETRTASTYEPFTQARYDAARAANKPILLFFYANWCPFCKEQDPRFARVIPEHEGGVLALRVNYNDPETDEDERALARELGVTYQHTMFFIGRDGVVEKKVIGSMTDEQTREHLNLISN